MRLANMELENNRLSKLESVLQDMERQMQTRESEFVSVT